MKTQKPFEILWTSSPAPVRIPVELRGESPPASSVGSVCDENLVVLFDDEALLGSGVLVRLSDGSLAVLTARHVVIDLVVSGAVHCVLPHLGWTSIEPQSLRVHPRLDVALVHLAAEALSGIPWNEWNPEAIPPGTLRGKVLAVGTPGAWKGPLDLANRKIAGLRGLAAWSSVASDAPVMGRVALAIDAPDEMPKRFGGMSGGPVFSPNGRLVGIITHESLSGPRLLYAAPLDRIDTLVAPFAIEPGAPQDLMRQIGSMMVPVQYKDAQRFPGKPFHVGGVFEHFWSASNPDYRISRLVALACATSETSPRFVMNTESIFYPSVGTLEEHIQQCGLELHLLLQTPSIDVLENGPAPTDEDERLLVSIIQRLAPNSRITLVRAENDTK